MTALVAFGRQPAEARITPSKPNPWYGSIANGERTRAGTVCGGGRFTGEQERELGNRGIDPRGVEVLSVRRFATMTEAWWPDRTPPPVFEFDCPVVGSRSDGRLLVITPSGDAKLVEADGWTTPPGKSKWRKA